MGNFEKKVKKVGEEILVEEVSCEEILVVDKVESFENFKKVFENSGK